MDLVSIAIVSLILETKASFGSLGGENSEKEEEMEREGNIVPQLEWE
jgi:hypothetical protein